MRLWTGDATGVIAVTLFRRPRACAQTVFWGLFDIHKLLATKGFSGQASKWAWDSMPAWRRPTIDHLGGNHIILSKHAGTADQKKQSVPFCDRMLSQPSVTSALLVMLLARWGHCVPARGGLRDPGSQQAASDFLRALILFTCGATTEREIIIVFDENWQCMWPRPNVVPDGCFQFPFQFNEDGTIDLKPLLCLQAGMDQSRVARAWSSAVFETQLGQAVAGTVQLGWILGKAAGQKKLKSFAAQLVWQLSRQLDAALAKDTGRASDTAWLSLEVIDGRVRVNSDNMDEQLFAYASAGVTASLGRHAFGFATDKANPCAGSIANSVISLTE